MQRVDAAEHPVADRRPVRPGPFGTDPEPARVPDRLGDVGGVDQHLRRDAPPVEAGAAEPVAFDHGDTPAGELLGRQHVPATRTHDDKVITVYSHTIRPSRPSSGAQGLTTLIVVTSLTLPGQTCPDAALKTVCRPRRGSCSTQSLNNWSPAPLGKIPRPAVAPVPVSATLAASEAAASRCWRSAPTSRCPGRAWSASRGLLRLRGRGVASWRPLARSGDDTSMRAERCPHKPERVLVGDRGQVLTGERPGAGVAEHGPVAAGPRSRKPPAAGRKGQIRICTG